MQDRTSSSISSDLSFAQGSNVAYIESMYREFLDSPESVDQDWQMFFKGYQLANGGTILGARGISSDAAQVEAFINAYRRLGHLSAYLNPLGEKPTLAQNMLPQAHGLEDIDLQAQFHPANLASISSASFQEINELLQETYCSYIGADFREINDIEIVRWLQDKMESCRNSPEYSVEAKKRILEKLAYSEGFETFLQARFLGQKRFSLEGLESLIPMLDTIASEAALLGGKEVNLGMAHRGRLNVLANFMQKNVEYILKEFEQSEFITHDIDGDVKYHLGFMSEVDTFKNGKILLNLLPNPSHLEAVNPVVEGFTKSRQRVLSDDSGEKVLPVLIHGDAAFVGQGVVSETLNLAGLPSYSTGGTIHIVSNNQIGFTTEPEYYRSGNYCTGIAKVIRAPVLHVNADHPEAVVWTAQLAVAYRQKFKRDIVIDLIGYRKHGHNETDEPSFTQPLMYSAISKHPSVCEIYSKKLVDEGSVVKSEVDDLKKDIRAKLQGSLDKIRESDYVKPDLQIPAAFQEIAAYEKVDKQTMFDPVKTAVQKDILYQVANAITTPPDDFKVHKKLARVLDGRKKMLEGSGEIDWPMAELLAFGTLACQGHHVRLSGQDCGRGTFSSRQIVWRDTETGARYEALNHIDPLQAPADVIDSPLSEAGVVGFEFGYSVAEKDSLVLWEAQFGDFANGAQILFDQFMVASEAKWKQTCGLVLLLPHGHEGMGPEHSSGRPERFLQLCGNNNIQVAIPTTAAQYFHILRRQIYRGSVHKPLVLMTPKSLLRESMVCSTIKEFTSGRFIEVLDDQQVSKKKVSRVVFCTGKVFYELHKMRLSEGIDDVAIVRIEQLYPLHKQLVKEIFDSYKSVKDVVWCQEEPQNMGAWRFIQPRLMGILGDSNKLNYVGRRGSGTTAEGSSKAHQTEQDRILKESLGILEFGSYNDPRYSLKRSSKRPLSKNSKKKAGKKKSASNAKSKKPKTKAKPKLNKKKTAKKSEKKSK